ncbi:MAG: hypothetical protein Q8L48_01325 [Archangium sp.]|nr:hypothetical protein [Archangium sp.]
MASSFPALCVVGLACMGAKPPPPSAATALLATFSPGVIGQAVPVVPVVPASGDYAMSLKMSSSHFVTTELRVDEGRTGVLRLTLAPDGTARACLGSRGTHVAAGQYHYEPDPSKRKHSSSQDVRLLALGGQWKVVDGVAKIQFDRQRWSSCELADAPKADKPTAELHCVGLNATDRVPAGSLACEAVEKSELLDLGMPMTTAPRPPGPSGQTPAGRSFMLGAPGLWVEVEQGARADRPTITFRAGPVRLVEADFQSPK